jgi:hypothetical protein
MRSAGEQGAAWLVNGGAVLSQPGLQPTLALAVWMLPQITSALLTS